MAMPKKIVVYIDGGNIYKRFKEMGILGDSKRFNYLAFINHLVGNERTLISMQYYIGIVKNYDNSEKGELMVRNQQKFLSHLQNEGFTIKSGTIMYDSGRIREKGVDVKFALDLVTGAIDGIYDTAIVISSDTDLIPAIKYVIGNLHKTVEYIGFGNKPSFGMIKECSVSRVLSEIDLVTFITDYRR
jgi:uncharacterized LabA/DUF88 family protein